MTTELALLLGFAAVALAAGALGLAVMRLRAATTDDLRTFLLGAATPLLGSGAYLLLGRPPVHLVVVLAFALAGGAVGFVAPSKAGRQSAGVLIAWSVVYCLVALAGLITAAADAQALLAVALAATAGAAVGVQLGRRRRYRGPPFGTPAAASLVGLAAMLGAGAALSGAPSVRAQEPDACVYVPADFTVLTTTRPAFLCAAAIRYANDSVDLVITAWQTPADAQRTFEQVHSELEQVTGLPIPVTTTFGERSFEADDDRDVTKIMFAKGQFTVLLSFLQDDRLGEARLYADEIARSLPGAAVGKTSPPASSSPAPVPDPGGGSAPGIAELLTLGGVPNAQAIEDGLAGVLGALVAVLLGVGAGLGAPRASVRPSPASAAPPDPFAEAAELLGREAQLRTWPGTLGRGLLPAPTDYAGWRALVNWPTASEGEIIDAFKQCTIGWEVTSSPDDLVACMRRKADAARAGAPPPAESPPPPAPQPAPSSPQPTPPAAEDPFAQAAGLLGAEAGDLPPLTMDNLQRWKELAGWPPGEKAHTALMNLMIKIPPEMDRVAILKLLRDHAGELRARLK